MLFTSTVTFENGGEKQSEGGEEDHDEEYFEDEEEEYEYEEESEADEAETELEPRESGTTSLAKKQRRIGGGGGEKENDLSLEPSVTVTIVDATMPATMGYTTTTTTSDGNSKRHSTEEEEEEEEENRNHSQLLSLLEAPKHLVERELAAVGGATHHAWIPDPQLAYRLVTTHHDGVTGGGKEKTSTTTTTVSWSEEGSGRVEKKCVESKLLQPASLSHYCADMAALTELNEPSVLHTIRSRYSQRLIHTYSGLFCVVVNPWKKVPLLYSREMIQLYLGHPHCLYPSFSSSAAAASGPNSSGHSTFDDHLPPHVYAVAQQAYDGVRASTALAVQQRHQALSSTAGELKLGQSILITGESGAGKTENTKKIIEYLIRAAATTTAAPPPPPSTSSSFSEREEVVSASMSGLDAAILDAGIALEAFSNAKTVHNDNSSRLGKFIRINFDRKACISSAKIDCYLLEKSRVVCQNAGNRNFHIFYQLFQAPFLNICSSSTTTTSRLLPSNSPASYGYLNQGGCAHVVKNRDDSDDSNFSTTGAHHTAGLFDSSSCQAAHATHSALRRLGFGSEPLSHMVDYLLACVLVGEIRFNERSGYDQSYVEDSQAVERVASLLGIEPASELSDALTQPAIRVGRESQAIRRSQNLRKTLASAAALAKVLYERLFAWVVDGCNAAIERESREARIEGGSSSQGGTNGSNAISFIGVLDMAGFEILKHNSFEQFCINYTNERLQQFFNQFMFVKEQRDYLREGIEWREVDFGLDLQPTIDMIEQPMGLIALLQEECIVPNGSDQSLLEKLVKNLAKHKSHGQVFAKVKLSGGSSVSFRRSIAAGAGSSDINGAAAAHFTIQHYAGQVAYNVDGWLEKNRDLVDQSLLDVLASSKHPLVSKLFSPSSARRPSPSPPLATTVARVAPPRRGSLATATVSHIYKEQLANLLSVLDSTTAHFIRCIVPNRQRSPFQLDGPLVLQQLRCNGVLEGIRICRRGYPNRELYAVFLARYYGLLRASVGGSYRGGQEEEEDTSTNATNPQQRRATEKLLISLGIPTERYQLGRTKIFCRAGLISELEALRRARIDALLAQLQAHCRWYLEQRRVGERYRQAEAVRLIQEGVRRDARLRSWHWYRLWVRVRNELLPLELEKRRRKEEKFKKLDEENRKLCKQNRELKAEVEKLRTATMDQAKIKKLEELVEDERQRNSALRQELKRNEDLLELMERKFDEQHAKVMRLNSTLTDNMRVLEAIEEEKSTLTAELSSLAEKHRVVSNERATLEENLRASAEECSAQLAELDELRGKLCAANAQLRAAEEKVGEWRKKHQAEKEQTQEMNRHIAELNERLTKAEMAVHSERTAKRKYECEVDELEEELHCAREELEKSTTRHEALKEQLRGKDSALRIAERRLDDKCTEMSDCLAELKRIHRASQAELQGKCDELRRKCMHLESELTQVRSRLMPDYQPTSPIGGGFDYPSVESTGGLARCGSRYSIGVGGGGSNSMTSSTISMSGGGGGGRGSSLATRRRETEPELLMMGLRSPTYLCESTFSYSTAKQGGGVSSTQLMRSPSSTNSSSAAAARGGGLSRTATLSNMTSSLTNTLDSGLARSSSTSSNHMLQLQSSERRVAQLERELQQQKSDAQLTKREVEVYKTSLQDAERAKETMRKQIQALSAEVERSAEELKAGEERVQQLEFDVRRIAAECQGWKRKNEEHIVESKTELMAEKKKHAERVEELKHDYELKLHHYGVVQRNHDELQTRLTDTESQLDKVLGQLAQMERMQRSQSAVGETWEQQYRCAMQEVESLRDENAALKSKIRRQYKQIELLTQQSELDSCVSDLESKVGELNGRLMDRSGSSVSCNSSSAGANNHHSNSNNNVSATFNVSTSSLTVPSIPKQNPVMRQTSGSAVAVEVMVVGESVN